MATYREATLDDFKAFYGGRKPPVTSRAFVMEVNGKIMAIAGFWMNGPVQVVYSDVKPEAPKFAVWKGAKQIMKHVIPPAVCSCDGGRSVDFLKRLGWEATPDPEVFVCREC